MNHLKQIQAALGNFPFDAIMLTSLAARRYATGFPASAGVVLITTDTACFLTDARYIEAARKTVRGAKVELVGSGEKYTDRINAFIAAHKIAVLGFEDETMLYRAYSDYAEKLTAKLVPGQKLISGLRAVKDRAELRAIEAAQAITDQVFLEILAILSPQRTEKEIAAEIVYRLLKNGAENISFDPIVVSGKNSSKPHGVPGDDTLSGFVTMDFGCTAYGYCSDMTRTVAVGSVTDEMRRVYETVLAAQAAGIAAARAGVAGREIDAAGRAVIEAAGFGDYFGHSFGHSLGLEVHEGPSASPTEERTLEAGTVVTAEPGIYIPDTFGVRIEDMILITETGHINLTRSGKELLIL